MSGSLPDGRVHEDGRIQSHHVLVQQDHGVPPVLLNIVLELNSILSVIIDRCESVVYFAGLEYISVFLAMCHQLLENVFLCHIYFIVSPKIGLFLHSL